MKDYLVTWYGITDFRSSLGFEKSGPILGALADGTYTDVMKSMELYNILKSRNVKMIKDYNKKQ